MITILKNKYVKEVGERYSDNNNIIQIIEKCCKKPFNVSKDKAPGFCLCKFKQPNLGRTYDNLDSFNLNYVSLDVDNHSLDEFKEQYKDYTYIFYTTSSHSLECPRFRVILEVKWPTKISSTFDEKNNLNRKVFKQTLLTAFPFTDPNALDITRFSILPLHSKYFEFHHNIGKAFDLSTYYYKANIAFNKDRIIQLSLFGKNNNCFERKFDVSNNEIVKKYLETSFNKIRGNGDSNNLLYTAICCCIGANDEKTLDEVLFKARSEQWTDSELNRKLTDAKKFLNKCK